MFRLEAAAALISLILVLWWGGTKGHLPALLVLGGTFAFIVLYRYFPIPAIGPIPSMYEPVWYTQKTLAAVAAGVGTLLALTGILLGRRRQNNH